MISRSLCPLVVSIFVLAWNPSFVAGEEGAADAAWQPTISSSAGELISDAMRLAETNVAAGIALLERHPRRDNDAAAIAFTRGNLYVEASDLVRAKQAYGDAMERFPMFRQAIKNLARVELMQEDPEGASEALRKLLTAGAADLETYVLLGHAYALNERPVSAEAAYRDALLRDPDHAVARRGLVKMLLRQERYREGAALCQEVLNTDPDDAELWSLQGNALVALERYEDAIRVFEMAERMSCLDTSGRLMLARLYINAGQPSDAVRGYARALPEATAADALGAARGFVMLGETDSAREVLALASLQAVDLPDEQQGERARLEARIALLEGDMDATHDAIERALKIDPLDGDALILEARIHIANGKLDEGAMSYERAARIPSVRVQALRAHAEMEVGRQQYEQAIRLLESAQTLDPLPAVDRYLRQVQRLSQLQSQ